MRPVAFIALLPLLGCKQLEDISDTLEGATNRFVVQGVHLGVEPPADTAVADALADTDFAEGARLTVFLADAADATDIENAPISGVDLQVLSDASGGALSLEEEGSGEYTLTGDGGLVYGDGEELVVSADYEGSDRRIYIDAPVAPDPGLDPVHSAGEALGVNLTGQGFDAALVVVIDTATSEVVFSNEPSDVGSLYDFTRGDGELAVEIPGEALADESIYAVGVAGINSAQGDDFEQVNTLLSTFLAGKFTFVAVCTLAESALCEQ